MAQRNWKPWIIVGAAVVIAAVAYPFYFNWWDHKNCRESGGTWSEEAGKCVEPAGTNIPETSGSPMHEDDNSGGS